MKIIQTALAAAFLVGTAHAAEWEFNETESFEGDTICSLTTVVDAGDSFSLGVKNGVVGVWSDQRPFSWSMKDIDGRLFADPGPQGIRVGSEYFSASMETDQFHMVKSKELVFPRSTEILKRFSESGLVQVRVHQTGRERTASYPLADFHRLLPQYETCMGHL